MSEPDPLLYCNDILEAIDRIERYTGSIGFEEFLQDTKTQDAVIRNLEIIGEAGKISRPTSGRHIPRWGGVPSRGCGTNSSTNTSAST